MLKATTFLFVVALASVAHAESGLVVCPNPPEALWYSNDLAAATQIGLPLTYPLMERIRQAKHPSCKLIIGEDIRATGDVFSGSISPVLVDRI